MSLVQQADTWHVANCMVFSCYCRTVTLQMRLSAAHRRMQLLQHVCKQQLHPPPKHYSSNMLGYAHKQPTCHAKESCSSLGTLFVPPSMLCTEACNGCVLQQRPPEVSNRTAKQRTLTAFMQPAASGGTKCMHSCLIRLCCITLVFLNCLCPVVNVIRLYVQCGRSCTIWDAATCNYAQASYELFQTSNSS